MKIKFTILHQKKNHTKDISEKIINIKQSNSTIKIIQKEDYYDSIIDIIKSQNGLSFYPKVSLQEGLKK